MATTKKQASNSYSTHLVGVVKSVLDSTRILVYSKAKFKSTYPDLYEKLSIYNLGEVYRCVKELSDVSIFLDRENTEAPYEFLSTYLGNSGFNVIMYIDNIGEPQGYTEFSLLQGKRQDVYITIDFKSSIELGGVTVKIENSLQSLRNKENKKTLTSALWDYTSSARASAYLDTLSLRPYYTSDLRAVVGADKRCVDFLPGVGVVGSSGKLGTLYLTKNQLINPGKYAGFTSGSIGLYGNDLVVYLWNSEGNFLIYGISKGAINIFGHPTSYVDLGTVGYSTIKPETESGLRFDKILYGAGKYLMCSLYSPKHENYRTGAYDTFRGEWVELEDDITPMINPFDPSGKVYKMKEYQNPYSLKETFPFLANLSYHISTKKDAPYGYKILKVVDEWVVMKRTYGEDSTWIASSPNLTVYMTENEVDRAVFLNDSTLMIDAPAYDYLTRNYYTIYQGSKGESFTTEYRLAEERGEEGVVWNNIYLASEDRKWLYESDKIKIAYQTKPVSSGGLNTYRRNALPRNEEGVIYETTPKYVWEEGNGEFLRLLGAYGGLMFYLDETGTKINFL